MAAAAAAPNNEDTTRSLPAPEEEEEKKEPRMAVFTVLKKGSILKHIFLNVPHKSQKTTSSSLEEEEEEEVVAGRGGGEEVILIGRHPDCHIVVDHPSISRFHLELRVSPSLQKLSVTDRSSVHGTWVSGKKIPANVPVDMVDGDALRLGASTRVYRLQWVSSSRAFEMENPLAPLPEEKEEAYQDDSDHLVADVPVDMVDGDALMLGESTRVYSLQSVSSSAFEMENPLAPLPEEKEEAYRDDSDHLVADVPVDMVDGDALMLGESTRVYSLQSVSSSAFQMENPLEPLLEEKEEAYQDDSAHSVADVSSQWVSEIPTAPPLIEMMEGSPMPVKREEHNPACKEAVEEKSPSFCAALMLDCLGSLPSMVEENWSPNIGSAVKEPSDVEHLGSLGFEKKGKTSSLLSRRSKSKCLKIQTARRQERVESTLGDTEADEGTSEVNGIVCEQAEKQDTLCRVLFGALNGQEDDKEDNFDADKENMTPMSARQKMNKRIGVLQKSFSATLNVDGDLRDIDDEKQTPKVLSEVKPKEPVSEKSAKNYREGGTIVFREENMTQASGQKLQNCHNKLERKYAATSNLSEELNDCDKEKNECNILMDLNFKEPSSQKVNRSCKKGTFGLDTNSLSPASGHKSKKIQDGQQESLTANVVDDWIGVAKEKQPSCVPRDLDLKDRHSENFAKSYIGGLETYNSDKENSTPASGQKSKILHKELHSIITALDSVDLMSPSDKENLKPDSCKNMKLGKPFSENCSIHEDKEGGFSSRKKRQMKPKENSSETCERITREIMKNRVERIPFQSLIDNSPSRSSNIPNHFQMNNSGNNCVSSSTTQRKETELNHSSSQPIVEVPHIAQEERKIWNIVVDTDCLLDEESRRSLQLLEGVRGTQLIIPRIVIRELDNLKRQERFFRKSTTKVSSVLQWIEVCMVNVSWWIHVQSSFETVPVVPTPPITPRATSDIGNNDFIEFNSLAFSSYGSLTEIVSPTAEDHILDCALLFRKVKNDGHLVLLSNSITLKIKAMAEGLLCETAKEFRESLVNPYSKRFLWADSSPRGSTWSCSDEVGLLENYYFQRPAVRKAGKATEAVKGLKLILLHNSQYGQSHSIK